MLSVFLVEDDATIARHVRVVIDRTQGMHCVGHADTIDAAMAVLPRLQPNVVLADLGLPDGDGTELIRALRSGRCAAPGWWPHVLAFSVFSDAPRVLHAIEAGADGYLLKGAPSRELVRAIEGAARGEAPLSPRVARHLLPRVEALERAQTQAPLAGQVLRLVAQGFMIDEVAERLQLSAHAAARQVRRAVALLHLDGRAPQVAVRAALAS